MVDCLNCRRIPGAMRRWEAEREHELVLVLIGGYARVKASGWLRLDRV